PALTGPGTKAPANPSLHATSSFKCPGHGTVLDLGASGIVLLHHAYRADDDGDARREILLDPLSIGADGWPVVGDDDTPVTTAASPLGATQSPAQLGFSDGFAGQGLAPGWEWLFDTPPGIAVSRGTLSLGAG